mgnify:CR=1 FL=1
MKPLDPRLLKYSKSSRGFLFSLVVTAVLSATATIAQAYLLTRIIVSLFQKHLDFSQNITQIKNPKSSNNLVKDSLKSIMKLFENNDFDTEEYTCCIHFTT